MFADSDYAEYLQEAETLLARILELNTDLLNAIDSREIHNRLGVLLAEDAELFRFFAQKRKAWKGGQA